MFRFFRRHHWLLIVALSLTVISFVFWGAAPSGVGKGGGQSGVGNLGSINGKKITPQEFAQALNEFRLFYFFHYGTWPEKNSNLTQREIDQAVYERLFLTQKASELGIHVGLEATATAANQLLSQLGRKNQTVSLDQFVTRVLQPAGMTAADFENFARNDVVIQQLIQSIGASGALITPQEAASFYEREHQELSSQIVFFNPQQYISSVKVTPEALGNFYTNYLAEYRLPDRIQLNYVAFDISSFLAQAKADWAKTNFAAQVDAVYAQYGAQEFPDAKTPDEAKAEIRELLIRNKALTAARAQANAFATAVFNLTPVSAENLTTIAKEKGYVVRTTAPFDVEAGPQEFAAPEGFTKAAFGLTPDEPFANPVVGTNGVYVIALARQLPSEIPAFATIRERVTQDFQLQQAIALARAAGTNFSIKLAVNLAAGKSFAATCTAAGLQPRVLPPISLSTHELPEIGNRIDLNQFLRFATSLPAGHPSDFVATEDGGFILFVQSKLPVDQAVMAAELPQFTETLRRSRENEAFNDWLQVAAAHALRDTPLARQQAGQ
jgi:hypothetical protein